MHNRHGLYYYLPVSMEISAACIAFSRAAGTRETMEARTGLEAMSPPAEASPLRATLPLGALLCSLAAGLCRITTARFGLVMEDQTSTTCQRYATSNPPVHEPGRLPIASSIECAPARVCSRVTHMGSSGGTWTMRGWLHSASWACFFQAPSWHCSVDVLWHVNVAIHDPGRPGRLCCC